MTVYFWQNVSSEGQFHWNETIQYLLYRYTSIDNTTLNRYGALHKDKTDQTLTMPPINCFLQKLTELKGAQNTQNYTMIKR